MREAGALAARLGGGEFLPEPECLGDALRERLPCGDPFSDPPPFSEVAEGLCWEPEFFSPDPTLDPVSVPWERDRERHLNLLEEEREREREPEEAEEEEEWSSSSSSFFLFSFVEVFLPEDFDAFFSVFRTSSRREPR